MEIFTLLKANIRHKKGSFISIIILMLIISMSFTAIFSIKDNCINSIENALNIANVGDLNVLGTSDVLDDELIKSVKEHSSVKDVITKEAISSFGTECKDKKDTSQWMLLKLTDEYRILNEDLSDYAEETPKLQKNEIYIPQGLSTTFGFEIGDKLKLETLTGYKEFVIKGFVVEPMLGSITIQGIKQVFISDEDFDILQKDAIKNSTSEKTANYRIVQVYKANQSLSDSDFKRQLNKDTSIIDYSIFSFTGYQCFYYTNIYPDIILKVLLVFVAFLVAIVLIVMAHSISTSIEMEYISLGVLKAQGFTKNKIRIVFALQYLFAEITGAIAGIALAVPLIKLFGNIFQPVLSIPTENNISTLASFLFIVGVLAISAIFILITTRKVGKISPMKAILGGKSNIYFSSRLNAPISKNALSSSLALRQFTSNKRRYIGTIIIISILMFFMITMNVLGTALDSKSAMESMGVFVKELNITSTESLPDETIEEIEDIIENYTEIEKKYFYDFVYMSLNGDEYGCSVYKNPEAIIMAEGRYPKYDNEIAITDILADELDLKIGDKVTVLKKNLESEYIITGLSVDASNSGLNFSMPLEAAKKLDVENILLYGFSLEDSSECKAIEKEINEKYSDILTAVGTEKDPNFEMYSAVRDAMTAIIYVISIVFSLVVVMMVCKKAFLQERKDIGIYKSLGFTSSKLRLQFAVRFLIVSIIGSALGSLLSVLFTQNALTEVFKLTGISSFNSQFTALSFIVPIAIIAISFFTFAYIASHKIKSVEIKELVIE